MQVQQISNQNNIGFGKKTVITCSNKNVCKGVLHMLRGDVEAIRNSEGKVGGGLFAKGTKLIIADGADEFNLSKINAITNEKIRESKIAEEAKDADVVYLGSYTGALRSEFDEIIKSENPVDAIIAAFKKHTSLA